MNGYLFYIKNILQVFYKKEFRGWGRKRTGLFALWCHKNFGGTLTLLEDGFIRSIGLGVDGSSSFSLVEDDMGIYYDATKPSRLEKILSEYDFASDVKLMGDARRAIELIKRYEVSKYNGRFDDLSVIPNFDRESKKILIIAQTHGDASLEYGLGNSYTTDQIIQTAIAENPDAEIYIKIHPDVLSGKKKSDIDVTSLGGRVKVITQNINPIALLKQFDKVYTKTSGMGFEALLCGCECVCFGMPYYAGWGVTNDRTTCSRRVKKRTVEEIFAAAYILYTHYTNPHTKKECDIFETIDVFAKKH